MANNKATRMAADFHDAPIDPRFAAAHYGNDLQEAGKANCPECNVIYPYHDIDCKTGRERGKANRVKATQAAPAVPEGLIEILLEAAEIIAAVKPDLAPECLRFPIVDELEGFASMLAAAQAAPD